MGTYYLAHHGIIEQQWGVRRGPPYPLARTADGRLNSAAQAKRKSASTQNSGLSSQVFGSFRKTPAEKEVLKTEKEARKARKAQEKQAAKEAKEQQKKLREEEAKAAKEAAKRLLEEQARKAEEDEKEALKQYIRHNPYQIYKFADAFTPEEMQSLIQQINLDRKVKDVRDEEIYRAKKYVEQGVSVLQTIANGSEQAIKLYNATASVWNAVAEAKAKDGEKPTLLPRIGGSKDDKNTKGNPNQNGGNPPKDQPSNNDKNPKGNQNQTGGNPPKDQPSSNDKNPKGTQNKNGGNPSKDQPSSTDKNTKGNQNQNGGNPQKTEKPKNNNSQKSTGNANAQTKQQQQSNSGADYDTTKPYWNQFSKTVNAYSNATPKEREKFKNEWANVIKNMDASDLSKPLSSVTDEKTIKAQAVNGVLRWFDTIENPKNK